MASRAQTASYLQRGGGGGPRCVPARGLWDSPVLQAHALEEPGEGRVNAPGISQLRLGAVVAPAGE